MTEETKTVNFTKSQHAKVKKLAVKEDLKLRKLFAELVDIGLSVRNSIK